MQYLVSRGGGSEWISDGEASVEAVDAAVLIEFASRVGMDWTEANADLDNQATDASEHADAHRQAEAMSDERLVNYLGLLIAQHRRDMLRSKAKYATFAFIANLFPKVPA